MNIVKAGAAAVLVLGVAVASAGIAQATEDDFFYDLNRNGIGGPADQLLALGNIACSDKGNGVLKPNSLATIQNNSQLGPADAAFLYDSATILLCPS